jgi:hypothetical protein
MRSQTNAQAIDALVSPMRQRGTWPQGEQHTVGCMANQTIGAHVCVNLLPKRFGQRSLGRVRAIGLYMVHPESIRTYISKVNDPGDPEKGERNSLSGYWLGPP